MPCPYLKEVVMLYCDAFPVKKMVPLDRLVSINPCFAPEFRRCPFYPESTEPPCARSPDGSCEATGPNRREVPQ